MTGATRSMAGWLEEVARERGTVLCLGLDPVYSRIPIDGEDEMSAVETFLLEILDRVGDRVAAVKPNSAFFEQYGGRGIDLLVKLSALARTRGIPVILDAKRGDIGTTAAAYARFVYDVVGADMVTLSPWLGEDSVTPFLDRCRDGRRGCYLLNRTSNPGGAQFQNLLVDGRPLYEHVTTAVADWHRRFGDGVGAVVGATAPDEFRRITALYDELKAPVPLLVPGVGAQGGDAATVVGMLRERGLLARARVNSSSAILYAHEKRGGFWLDAVAAEVEATRALLPAV